MRIRPEEYGDVDYRTQKPVAGLWFSEGLTLYYADLFLRSAGLPVQHSTRLAHLESLIGRYLASPGNARFSAERISRVAYNAEPGALGDYNASVHLVGELLGTMLDIAIRDATAGRHSMDDVMRAMLERYSGERGFSGRGVERIVEEVCGCRVRELFDSNVRGAAPLAPRALPRLRLPQGRVEDRPQVDQPAKEEEPEHPREHELDDRHHQAPLNELSEPGNEEAAQRGDDISGGTLGHNASLGNASECDACGSIGQRGIRTSIRQAARGGGAAPDAPRSVDRASTV